MKLVAVVVMLLASTAFGAAIVAPATVDGKTGTASVTIGVKDILADLPAGMYGYGLSATTSAPVTIVLRTNLSTDITDPTTANASVNGKVLSTIADLGYTGAPFSTSVTADSNLVQFDLSFAPVTNTPITITWTAKFTATDLSAEVSSVGTTVLTPEPISALLLGLGSLFFARRRRA